MLVKAIDVLDGRMGMNYEAAKVGTKVIGGGKVGMKL